MELYPLHPSSNESVIDNGRNVWQIYFKDRLWRLTKAFTKRSLSIEGSGFQWNPRFFLTTCSNNVVYLTHAGVLPWRFSVHFEKKTRRQSRTVEEEHDFCCFFFFFFSACSKADGRCTSTRCRTGARSTWPSKAQSISADRPLPMRAPSAFEKRQRRPWILLKRLDAVSTAAHWRWRFFFNFYLLSIAQRNLSKPPPPDMKVLSFVRDVWNFEMTP